MMTILPLYTGLLPFLADTCVAAACLGCIYLLAASVAVLRIGQGRDRTSSPAVPVTVLKPLYGAEPGLAERLSSLRKQNYAGPVQIVCGVRDRQDPAAQVARQLAAETSDTEIVLTVDPREHGRNRKVSNLANMLPLASHDTLVISDSDIEVGPDYLAKVIGELQRPGVGAVTCFYHGVPASGMWSRQCALAINTHFLPNAIFAVSTHLAQPCFGSTIAIRRSTLRRIDGIGAFANCLADDHAIGDAVRAAGDAIVIPPFTVGHVCFDGGMREMLKHELRAARTIKSIDPIGYCGAVITHPLPLSLIGALLGSADAMFVAAIALSCRVVLCLCVEHAFTLKRQPYGLIPVRELLSFGVYLFGLFGTTVTWRGFIYRMTSNGGLTPKGVE